MHHPRRDEAMTSTYEVRLGGRLSSTLIQQFGPLHLVADDSPGHSVETLLQGPVEDQAALHGLIRRIESLGLELVALRRLPGSPSGSSD
jgi:hypothetical protein